VTVCLVTKIVSMKGLFTPSVWSHHWNQPNNHP